jgi:hypothetical protein
MNGKQLQELAEEILLDFEKTLNDINVLTGYMYDERKLSRLKGGYLSQLSSIVVKKFSKFQVAYEKRLNLICEKSIYERTSGLPTKEKTSTKTQFWLDIYKKRTPEFVIQKYLQATKHGNDDFIQFIENEFLETITDESYKRKFEEVIKSNKKHGIRSSTKNELDLLKSLYGFYMHSIQFTKSPHINPSFIQELFATLDRYLHIPLTELIPK